MIWPGGVGKTTIGLLLAKELWRTFIDIDDIFKKTIQPVTPYVQEFWYECYIHRNTALFIEMMKTVKPNTVISLSWWFLVYPFSNDHLVEHGTTILLLPSDDIVESVEIVMPRQATRDFFLNMDHERERFTTRYNAYQGKWDIVIYTWARPPKDIASEVSSAYQNFIQSQ
jgi:shikimate kinase